MCSESVPADDQPQKFADVWISQAMSDAGLKCFRELAGSGTEEFIVDQVYRSMELARIKSARALSTEDGHGRAAE